MTIRLTVVTGPNRESRRSYKTIEGARRAAEKAVTAHPRFDPDGYAVHPVNGTCLFATEGVSYWALFPEVVEPLGDESEIEVESVVTHWTRLLRVPYLTAEWVDREVVAAVRKRCSTEHAALGSKVAQEWVWVLVSAKMMNRYIVRVAEEGGPGKELRAFETPAEARRYISESGIAYEHHHGVCIEDRLNKKFDFGDENWSRYPGT